MQSVTIVKAFCVEGVSMISHLRGAMFYVYGVFEAFAYLAIPAIL
jgi:hypothetical protein